MLFVSMQIGDEKSSVKIDIMERYYGGGDEGWWDEKGFLVSIVSRYVMN